MQANLAQDKGTKRKHVHKSVMEYWTQCIRHWYPHLHKMTYFFPPLHFNRVSYIVQNVSGKDVLQPCIATDQPAARKHSLSIDTQATKSCTHARLLVKESSLSCQINDLIPCYAHSLSSFARNPTAQDNHVRDDEAQNRVLHCLRALGRAQKEVMMVISQLQFGYYLSKPCYAAAAAYPRANDLEKTLRQGDFDVLIIHSKYGLIAGEIKSVGGNFSQLGLTVQKENELLVKTVQKAIKQLNRSGEVVSYLVSDVAEIPVIKTLILVNVTARQLIRAMKCNRDVEKELCQCLCVRDIETAVDLCLCADGLTTRDRPWDVSKEVMSQLRQWWQRRVSATLPETEILPFYEHLIARFCGPASTIEIRCVTPPRLDIRTEGEGVSETGERVSRLVLFPQQLVLLNTSPPRVFLNGPPGTGKTVVLTLQGLSWLQHGHDIDIVSSWPRSRASSIVIEHQLLETRHEMKAVIPETVVRRHQYDFGRVEDVLLAVNQLACIAHRNRQLCIIMDEAGPCTNDNFTDFCSQIMQSVPEMHLWAAAVEHREIPSFFSVVTLTAPLRSPPVVIREVMKAAQIHSGVIKGYNDTEVPAPTDGPTVKIIRHYRSDQSGHNGDRPDECVMCGHHLANVLTELHVGQTESISRNSIALAYSRNPPPSLQYRDVLVLCDKPRDDHVNDAGQVTSTAIGIVQGLRAEKIPVRVIDNEADDAAVLDVALAFSNQVIVVNKDLVQGLERKVVVVAWFGQGTLPEQLGRLQGASRCTSQLVWIYWE